VGVSVGVGVGIRVVVAKGVGELGSSEAIVAIAAGMGVLKAQATSTAKYRLPVNNK
jgi:hypothetical protein